MITEALFQIREDMDRLRAAMIAKGHIKAIASFKIEDTGRYCIHLDTEIPKDNAFTTKWGGEAPYVFPAADSYAEVLAEAQEYIATMRLSAEREAEEEAKACEAWFQTEAAAELDEAEEAKRDAA